MKPIYLMLLLCGALAAPAYATTMLLRGEYVVEKTRYCIYSMSSLSEQRIVTQPYYMSCKKLVNL